MGRLEGQVAIVTGGAQGIGGACSRRLAEEGARVLVTDIDMGTAEANAASIREAGGVAESFRADLFSHADIKAMVDKASSLWGRLDILVNNGYTPIPRPGTARCAGGLGRGMGRRYEHTGEVHIPGGQVRRARDAEDGSRQHHQHGFGAKHFDGPRKAGLPSRESRP